MNKLILVLPVLMALTACKESETSKPAASQTVATPAPSPSASPEVKPSPEPAPVAIPEAPKVKYREGYERICTEKVIKVTESKIQDLHMTLYPGHIYKMNYVVESCAHARNSGSCGSLPVLRKTKWGSYKYLGGEGRLSLFQLEGVHGTYEYEESGFEGYGVDYKGYGYIRAKRYVQDTRPLTVEEDAILCAPVVEKTEPANPACRLARSRFATYVAEDQKIEIKMFQSADKYSEKYILRVKNYDCIGGGDRCLKVDAGEYVEVSSWMDVEVDGNVHYYLSGQYGFTRVIQENGVWNYYRGGIFHPVKNDSSRKLTEDDIKLACEGERD